MGASAFHKSLWAEIIRRYETGEEIKSIANDLGIDPKTVYNAARRKGLPNRHVFDPARRARILSAYEAGVPVNEIARTEHVHRTYVRKLASRAGIPARQDWRRLYPLDEQAFDDPTPIGWWLIGLLAADGHVRHEENLVALTQTARDIDVLHAFYDYLGCPDRPLIELRLSPAAAKRAYCRKRAFAARVQSKQLCAALARHGVKPRKTNTLVLSKKAAEQPAVWLGLLDGDGWVGTTGERRRPVLAFYGTKRVMEQCSDFWAARLSFQRVTGPTVYRHVGSLHGIRLYGRNAANASEILLGGSPLSLQRKRRTLEAIAGTSKTDGMSAPPRVRTSENSN